MLITGGVETPSPLQIANCKLHLDITLTQI